MNEIIYLIVLILLVVIGEAAFCIYYDLKMKKMFPNDKEEMKQYFAEQKKNKTGFWQNIISYDHKQKGGDKE